jgi:chromate transporter
VIVTIAPARQRGHATEVFSTFLKLGLSSFGGPIAHLGYFRDELVIRRRWLSDAAYADTVALCQFLPGPASSQVGFALGILRSGGLRGGIAAWLGFTLPSALLLYAFAVAAAKLNNAPATGLLHGLKLVAVAVVAQALFGMARVLTPDLRRIVIALTAAVIVALAPASIGQIAAIAFGGLLGMRLCPSGSALPAHRLAYPVTRRAGRIALAIFAVLLVAGPLLATEARDPRLMLFDAFYRSGALVFGGGHVVLPLLQAQVVTPGWISDAVFLDGYGVAQAIPGPLFSFAAYLGTVAHPAGVPGGISGAATALIAIFLPGLLLVFGMLPFWDSLRARPFAQAAMRGANAAVVGILALAFVTPVCASAFARWSDPALALAGFMLLTRWRMPAWIVVVLLAGAGIAQASY